MNGALQRDGSGLSSGGIVELNAIKSRDFWIEMYEIMAYVWVLMGSIEKSDLVVALSSVIKDSEPPMATDARLDNTVLGSRIVLSILRGQNTIVFDLCRVPSFFISSPLRPIALS